MSFCQRRHSNPRSPLLPGIIVLGLASAFTPQPTLAAAPPAVAPAILQAQALAATPPSPPPTGADTDSSGAVDTIITGNPAPPQDNAFFLSLGTNGRSCSTCHDPQVAWTVTPASIQARYTATNGTDPLFRLIDGATCPSDSVATPAAMRAAYALLLGKGLFRYALTLPSSPQFTFSSVVDPYNCTTSAATGLTSPGSGTVSVYRRPLPTTNLRFVSTLMWDGREPSLTQQAIDATLIHAQATTAPSAAQISQIVGFESDLYTAQSEDNVAQALNAAGATGGPQLLTQQPVATAVKAPAFTLYTAWATLTGTSTVNQARLSIARGEQIFNTRPIVITGVAGLNDGPAGPSVQGTCATCHSGVNVGGLNTRPTFLNTGVTGLAPPALDVSGLPRFTLTCASGPLAGQTFGVTDPGVALISGNCADIGKTKVPGLRALAARAPYFHNGSAAQLGTVVDFYNQRFTLNLTAQERTDLVNFLQAL